MVSSSSTKKTASGFVAIAGRPNVGKSTLLNRVLGTEISIVTPKAQTTREQVRGILSGVEGQIVFIDTPGIHRAKAGGINEFMMSEVEAALDAPHVLWYLVDPNSALKFEQPVIEKVVAAQVPVLVIFNKVDVRAVRRDPNRLDQLQQDIIGELRTKGVEPAGVYRLSARYGQGVESLMEDTWKKIPQGPAYYPDLEQVADRPVRFFVAEKIREQLFLQLGEEVPYSCAVRIESFKEDARPISIRAAIVVERESQQGMVIGKGGQKIKAIGQAARGQIERFLGVNPGESIFLGLRVDVMPNWSKDRKAMKNLGYALPERRAL